MTFTKATGQLALRIEPVGSETFVTRFVGSRQGRPPSETFAEVKGIAPTYQLRGDELYVRAIVVSTGKPTVESTEFPTKRAWTQPVGW